MKLQIAYKPMFSKYWAIMSLGFEFNRIVPCEYALVIDGEITYKSKKFSDVKKVRERIA